MVSEEHHITRPLEESQTLVDEKSEQLEHHGPDIVDGQRETAP